MVVADVMVALAEEAVIGVAAIAVGLLIVARSRQVGALLQGGVAWIAARAHRPNLPVWLPRIVRVAGWWLLTRALRAHGKHRAVNA